jgi:hypothetical protein
MYIVKKVIQLINVAKYILETISLIIGISAKFLIVNILAMSKINDIKTLIIKQAYILFSTLFILFLEKYANINKII